MKKESIVTVYTITVQADYEVLEEFAESISKQAITIIPTYDLIVVVANTNVLNATQLENAIMQFFKEYEIRTIGLIGLS